MYKAGWNREKEIHYDDAIATYDSVAKYFPASPYAKLVPDRLLACKKKQNMSWSDIRRDFFQMAQDSMRYPSVVQLCKTNAAWCLVRMGNYTDGYNELVALLNHSSKDWEKLAIALKLLITEMQQNGNPSPSIPGSDSERRLAIQRAMQEQFRVGLNRIDSLILVMGQNGQPQTVPGLPASYALFQNCPNPFNPTTEIRFDVPENIQVQLKIYNTLGQEVTTLLDQVRPAGSYTIQWNGKNSSGLPVAAGMYLYQFKAGNFTSTKKMLLLK